MGGLAVPRVIEAWKVARHGASAFTLVPLSHIGGSECEEGEAEVPRVLLGVVRPLLLVRTVRHAVRPLLTETGADTATLPQCQEEESRGRSARTGPSPILQVASPPDIEDVREAP